MPLPREKKSTLSEGRTFIYRVLKNKQRAVSQGENQLKAPGSKLKGKNELTAFTLSASSFELAAFRWEHGPAHQRPAKRRRISLPE